jgi:CheY-like chemotaxis protein
VTAIADQSHVAERPARDSHGIAIGGIEILRATNGRQAVELAMTSIPDLILLDVVMPEMNGIEVCRILRSQPDTEHIPIVMATTRGEPRNIEEGYAAGCTDYVTKPLNRGELARKLRELLSE